MCWPSVSGVTAPREPAPGGGQPVSGPAQGGYDADRVAAAARSKDPGLPEQTARELAVRAWEHLQSAGQLDAPEVARRLLADDPAAGASPAAVVAKAAVDFCDANGVALS